MRYCEMIEYGKYTLKYIVAENENGELYTDSPGYDNFPYDAQPRSIEFYFLNKVVKTSWGYVVFTLNSRGLVVNKFFNIEDAQLLANSLPPIFEAEGICLT